jgi:hypothetical protein
VKAAHRPTERYKFSGKFHLRQIGPFAKVSLLVEVTSTPIRKRELILLRWRSKRILSAERIGQAG